MMPLKYKLINDFNEIIVAEILCIHAMMAEPHCSEPEKILLQNKAHTLNSVQAISQSMLSPEEMLVYDDIPIPELARLLRDMKLELDQLSDEKIELQKKYDFLSIDIIPDRMDDEGIDSVKVAGVGRLQTAADIRCNVLAGNKEALQNWLKDNGHGSMIKDEVNPSTFKAFIKEQMKENKPYPSELVKITPFSRASIVRG